MELLTELFNAIMLNSTSNNILALWLYWLPVLICIFGYSIWTYRDIQKDLTARRTQSSAFPYEPTITVGTLMVRVINIFLPFINLLKAAFHFTPEFTSFSIRFCEKFFDFPLIPPNKR